MVVECYLPIFAILFVFLFDAGTGREFDAAATDIDIGRFTNIHVLLLSFAELLAAEDLTSLFLIQRFNIRLMLQFV